MLACRFYYSASLATATYNTVMKESALMTEEAFTVTPWEKPLDNFRENCGFAGIFKGIGIIGDSLASGEFEYHDQEGNIVYPVPCAVP